MVNWHPEDPDMYEDVQTRWQYAHTNLKKSPQWRLERMWRSSRDNARTPVQWSSEANGGFTTGTPWFYVNPNYPDINVAQQENDPDSLLNFYRKAIALRKSLPCVRHGSYREFRKHDGKRYVYARVQEDQKILVVCSFADRPISFRPPAGFDLHTAELALQNYPQPQDGVLQPYETRVYLWNR